jgi:hypothetical protein
MLRAHVLLWTGDIPAISKLVNLMGHNAYMGCRHCNICGVYNDHIYFPLSREHSTSNNNIQYNPQNLPLRTHQEYLQDVECIEAIQTNQAKINRATERGKFKLFEYFTY